jgi:hypothetical protein
MSWFGGLLAVWAIFAVGNAFYGRWAGIGLAALWGMAPASLTLTMGYPEGMFTAAAAATLFCLIRRRPVWAGVCASAAELLRPSAVAGKVAGYFTVQGQWGQRTAALTEYTRGIEHGLFSQAKPAALIPVTLAVCMGYLLLFCLIVFDRRLAWGQRLCRWTSLHESDPHHLSTRLRATVAAGVCPPDPAASNAGPPHRRDSGPRVGQHPAGVAPSSC